MPDRPDGFDDDVRDALEGMASEPSPPPNAPPGVLSSARRRVARNSAAVVVAVSVIAGGVAFGIGLTNQNDGTPVPIGSSETPSPAATSAPATSGPSSPSSTSGSATTPATSVPATSAPNPVPAPSFGPWSGPDGTMLFVDGVLYQFALGSEQPAVVGISPDETAVQPPVWTRYGTVVLGEGAGAATHLWLIDGGTAKLIASHADGFAVSADGKWVAYATLNEDSTASVIQIRPLFSCCATSIKTSSPVDAYVRVVGFIGQDVLVSTGDGAAASAAVWSESQRSLQRLDGYGSAIATDPATGFAALTEGDGRCWDIVPLVTGNVGGASQAPKRGPGCGIAQASFEPGGDAVAVIILTSEDRSGPQRFVLAGTTSQLGGAADVDGAFQTWWAKPANQGTGSILVLTEPEPDHLALVECRVSENLCSDQPSWTATGAGDPGTAWIVEERPAP